MGPPNRVRDSFTDMQKLAAEGVIRDLVGILTDKFVKQFTRGKQFQVHSQNLSWPIARRLYMTVGDSLLRPREKPKK